MTKLRTNFLELLSNYVDFPSACLAGSLWFWCGLTLSLVASCGGGNAVIKPGTMPSGGDFSGVWHSPQYGEMHIVQNGPFARGRYDLDERHGTLHGEVEGDLLRFEWVEKRAMVANRPTETRGHGYFRYQIDPGNGDHVLKGRWGLDDDDRGGGEWNAYKLRNREPELGNIEPATSGGESPNDQAGDDPF